LNFGQQASQLCHALRQFSNDHPEIDKEWFNNSNYICLLAVASESDLINLINKSEELELKYSKFLEPDLNNSLTAICIEPGKLTKKLVNNLKLAFK
jgi:peptidyl-tRNA hydrolase